VAVVLAGGFLGVQLLSSHPAWAAGVINAAHAAHLSSYRAEIFGREHPLPYSVSTVADPNLPQGLHQIRTPGQTGAVWQAGLLLFAVSPARPGAHAASARPAPPPPAPAEVKVFSQRLIASPRPAVIAVGTSPSLVQVGGHFYHYARVLQMRATAYDATWASNGRWTGARSALGLPLDYGVVAVDPRVIALGSRLYVEHYGLAVAADTGSAIVGDRIDLFFWDTPRDIAAFGIHTVGVYVLDDMRLRPARSVRP